MRVLRGRAASLAADRASTADLVDEAAATGEPGLRVWYPHPHVAFGRRDTRAEGYDRARASASGRGYSTVERSVGGRAVAFTGDVLAFVRAEPTDHGADSAADPAIDERYDRTQAQLEGALGHLGVDGLRRAEPQGAFCPGTHALSADGKVAGLAQRVRRAVAVVGGVLVVDEPEAVAEVLGPVYETLDVPFDPESVGSVATAGGDLDPVAVRDEVERALLAGRRPTAVNVRDT